jgi:hypothetical protein
MSNRTAEKSRTGKSRARLANVQTVKHMLQRQFLADMPIACRHRSCFLYRQDGGCPALDGEKKEILGWESLRSFSLGWHRARGFDVTIVEKKLHNLMEH